MKHFLSIITVIFLLMLFPFISSGEMGATKSSLAGEWQAVNFTIDGKEPYSAEQLADIKMTLGKEGEYISHNKDQQITGVYNIATEHAPNWITITTDASNPRPFDGLTLRGIFLLEGDKLTVVTNMQRRPKELSSKPTSQNMMTEYRRIVK